MRTRCPQCNTVFRITPEQLRLRAGKVRCGHCRAVFNALETLVEEPPAVVAPPPVPESVRTGDDAIPPAVPETPPPLNALDEPAEEMQPAPPSPAATGEDRLPEDEEAFPEPNAEATAEESSTEDEAHPEEAPASAQPSADLAPDQAVPDETPEESTEAARAAGLVAARDLTEAPGYNRWASNPLSGIEAEPRQGVTWPFTLAAILLAFALAAQAAYHFRTPLVQRIPAAAGLFAALGIPVPLPRQADLVSIEASDLQADAARGLLVLQATLKNRAPYAQAWPALELTLTDAQDAVVARRILLAADYLPPQAEAKSFAANGEIAIRLWIAAKGVAAAGYRLYVFYP